MVYSKFWLAIDPIDPADTIYILIWEDGLLQWFVFSFPILYVTFIINKQW